MNLYQVIVKHFVTGPFISANSNEVIIEEPTQSFEDALNKFTEHKVKCVEIVNKNGEYINIIADDKYYWAKSCEQGDYKYQFEVELKTYKL